MMRIHLLMVVTYIISFAETGLGDIRIVGEHNHPDRGRLEVLLSGGTWGTVCGNSGFDNNAATVACNQLGYDGGVTRVETKYHYDDVPSAVCYIDCAGHESRLEDCRSLRLCSDLHENCYDDVILSCYATSSATDSTSGGPSIRSVIGATLGAIIIIVLVILVITCRVYIRHSYFRRQSHPVVDTQQRTPRVVIAKMTHTMSLGPPPPPAYTPSAPNAGYTPVPARGHQPVPTTDYSPAEPTNTPSVSPNDIPSDPPPEYTPTVSTNVPVPVASVNENSAY